MPESTITLCQSLLSPPVRDFGCGLCTLCTWIIQVADVTGCACRYSSVLGLVSLETYKIPTAIKDYFPTISKLMCNIGNRYAVRLTTVLPPNKKNLAYASLINHTYNCGGCCTVNKWYICRRIWCSGIPQPLIFQASIFTVLYCSLDSLLLFFFAGKYLKQGELQRDVVYLGWPIARSYMSTKVGEGWKLGGLSQWVQP